MGQAKNRGSKEDRKRLALIRDINYLNKSITEMIQKDSKEDDTKVLDMRKSLGLVDINTAQYSFLKTQKEKVEDMTRFRDNLQKQLDDLDKKDVK